VQFADEAIRDYWKQTTAEFKTNVKTININDLPDVACYIISMSHKVDGNHIHVNNILDIMMLNEHCTGAFATWNISASSFFNHLKRYITNFIGFASVEFTILDAFAVMSQRQHGSDSAANMHNSIIDKLLQLGATYSSISFPILLRLPSDITSYQPPMRGITNLQYVNAAFLIRGAKIVRRLYGIATNLPGDQDMLNIIAMITAFNYVIDGTSIFGHYLRGAVCTGMVTSPVVKLLQIAITSKFVELNDNVTVNSNENSESPALISSQHFTDIRSYLNDSKHQPVCKCTILIKSLYESGYNLCSSVHMNFESARKYYQMVQMMTMVRKNIEAKNAELIRRSSEEAYEFMISPQFEIRKKRKYNNKKV
jgi:hypothetical protein